MCFMGYVLLVCSIAEHDDVHWCITFRPKQQGQRVCYLTPCHSLKKWLVDMFLYFLLFELSAFPFLFSRRAVSLVHTLNVKYKVTHSHKRFNAGGNGSNRPWASYTRLFDALGIRGGVAATACSNHSGDGDRGLEENGEKMYNTVFVLGGPGSGKGTQVNCRCCYHLYCMMMTIPCL